MEKWLTYQPLRPPIDRPDGYTRIRLVEPTGDTIGVIWTDGSADDEYIRSLIPDGVKAMVARNVWPS